MTGKPRRAEDSEIYVGQTVGGVCLTVSEYVGMLAACDEAPPALFCPMCVADDGEPQMLDYHPAENRFVHKNVTRDCFNDDRCNESSHPFLQQRIYAHWQNNDRYTDVDPEFEIGDNNYDCGATFENDSLNGVVAEIQHSCGNFHTRIRRKIRIAHRNNHGVYVVFSPAADEKAWFRRRLRRGLNAHSATIGTYAQGHVQLGTLIRPGQIDLSVFPRSPRQDSQQSLCNYA